MIHSYEVVEAKEHGIIAAVILYNIRFWVSKNAANEQHCYNGRYWTYNSVKAFSDLFPEMTSDQIRRAIEKLVAAGVVMVDCFNENKHDRTRWYSVDVNGEGNKSICEPSQLDLASTPNVYKETDINTDKEKDKKADASKDAISTPRSKKMTLQKWIETEREAGRSLVSKDDPIFADGLPADYVILAWKTFADTVKPSKLQIDWRQTFRNYVRGDYLKLWAVTRDGQFFLTTAGKQNAIRFGMQDLIA